MKISEVKTGTMVVFDDLYWDSEEEFVRNVDLLLNSPEKSLKINLTRVRFLFSPFIGHIVRFCSMAKELGKNPSVLIGPQLEDIFTSSGLIKELPIQIVATHSV